MDEARLLVVSDPDGDRGVAVARAIAEAAPHLEVVTAVTLAGVRADVAAAAPVRVQDLAPRPFDIVITLGAEARRLSLSAPECRSDAEPTAPLAFWIGNPVLLHWESPAAPDGYLAMARAFVELGVCQALLAERRLLTHVLDTLEEGLIVHDHARHIFLFNRAAERITGYSREEVLGQNCHHIFAPDGICSSQCPFKEGEEGSLRRDDVVTFTTRDGEDRRLHLRMAPLPAEPGRPPTVLAVMRDVTEVMELRFRLSEKYSFHGMVGRSAAMREIFQTIRQVTTSDYPVLITGESGTGKELVARAIHQESRRRGGPFVPINCGALPESILESELFGHVRGAFTGAVRDKKGRFDLAHGGTLFLDEVGELSPAFQVKLLRVLQEKRFEPVGGEESRHADVRVIAATNRDLSALVREGKFREDLFYRLAVVPIHLPPLRDRREDLPMLVEQILSEIRKETGREHLRLSGQALEDLLAYPWPGNVRELINVLQYASIRAAGGLIEPENLPLPLRSEAERPAGRFKLSRQRVEEALQKSGGNRKAAARMLGVGRATLYRYLEREKKSTSRRGAGRRRRARKGANRGDDLR